MILCTDDVINDSLSLLFVCLCRPASVMSNGMVSWLRATFTRILSLMMSGVKLRYEGSSMVIPERDVAATSPEVCSCTVVLYKTTLFFD